MHDSSRLIQPTDYATGLKEPLFVLDEEEEEEESSGLLYDLGVVNSQAEFNKIAGNLNGMEFLAMQNWVASRRASTSHICPTRPTKRTRKGGWGKGGKKNKKNPTLVKVADISRPQEPALTNNLLPAQNSLPRPLRRLSEMD